MFADELAMMFTGRHATPAQTIMRTTETTEEDGSSTPVTMEVESTLPASPAPLPVAASAALSELPHPLFAADQIGIDRRLLVNRKRQLKMYRIWMQAKFRKLPAADTPPGAS